MKPAKAMLAVRRNRSSLPTTPFRYSTWPVVRPSFHRIAGRMTRSCPSSATNPCICPPQPMPLIRAASKPRSSSGTPDRTASHQSSGLCSAQPGLGKASGYSRDTVFSTLPSPLTSRSLQAEVPRSIPI